MKCYVINVIIGLFMLVLTGCGGGGGDGTAASRATTETANNLITNIGWLYENAAPDYYDYGPTCILSVNVFYNESIDAADIDSFGVTAPNGWKWTLPSADSQFGTSTSGKPYIGGNLYYGANRYTMPLAGTWVFQLKLKNGQISSVQKTLHEPSSTADATHQYVYADEDWTSPTNASDYIAALGRFPAQGYKLQYSAANGGTITTTGLSATRSSFLAAEPHAYNMVCWLYDYKKDYIGYTISEYSPQDHSRTNLITANGELSIVPASTISSTGQISLSTVKYIRFVYHDGAQYAPSSYANSDYRSISSLVAVSGTTTDLVAIAVSPANATLLKGTSQQYTAMGTFSDNTVQDITSLVLWNSSDSSVATISNADGYKGSAVSVNNGSTLITATLEAVSGSAPLVISPWAFVKTGTTNKLYGVAWSGSQFVAVGESNTILTSPDVTTWSQVSSGSYSYFYRTAWLGTHFATVGSGDKILTSPDGITWTPIAFGSYGPLAGIVRSDNLFVAVGNGIYTSTDELTWVPRAPSLTKSLYGIAWSGTQFVTVGNDGTIVSSPDGITWTSQISGTSNSLNSVAWSGAQFVAVGSSGTILSSTDGNTWTPRGAGITDSLYGIAWSGKQFVAVGSNGLDYTGSAQVLTSPDGVTWTKVFGSTYHNNSALIGVTCFGSRIVAVGINGTILVSPVLE